MALVVQSVSDIETLKKVLRQFKVPLSGARWTKTPKQLLGQIKDGETVLADANGILRQFTWRVQANVFRRKPNGQRQRLVEKRRVVNGKEMKPKAGVSVSEKLWIFRGETPIQGIIRCFKEELGITDVSGSDFIPIDYFVNEPSKSSSFPLSSQSCITLYEHEMPYAASKKSYTERRERKITTWGWEDVGG